MDLASIKSEVIALAKKAGVFMQEQSLTFDDSQVEFKEFNNLVSYVDKQTEEILVEGLKEILPSAGFITEEGTATHNEEEYKWIIDPLDGTTNFTHKLPVYSISIGLALGNKVILGVVHEPNRDECFHAYKGGGAFCNDKKINVTKHQKLEQTLLATGFPYYMFDKLENYIDILKHFMQNTQGLRRMGSAAVDLCYVACGRFDGYYEYNLNPYDIAGGAIIVEEAGGIVSRFDGTDDYISGEEIIAASPAIHQAMQTIIHKEWNK